MYFTHRSMAPRLALAALVLALLACNAVAATPTPGFSALQTVVALTMQAGTAHPSAIPTFSITTPIPSVTPAGYTPLPTLIPPTSVAPVTPTFIPPAGTRLHFDIGTTQVVSNGNIQPGQSFVYYVRALEGQPMIASVDTPNGDATLAIYGANGVTLLPASQRTSNWQGELPSTQDYYFEVIGGSSVETFTLNVVIAARVQFDPGEIRAVFKGTTVNGFAVTYAAYARQGQKMDVVLDVVGESAGLTIWGFSDGEPYARAQNGVQDFSLRLPSTQDYMIQVVPRAGRVVDYTLTIKIK